MVSIFLYTIISVLIVSLISLLGILSISIKPKKLQKILIYLVSFSAGALLGDAFIHLLPEIVEKNGFTLTISLFILLGISIFFLIEKVVLWQHCHVPQNSGHIHSFAITNLIGDGLHNFIDGIIIGASYIVSIPAGIATTLAVILHEIPQEIGDFGVLLHGGFSKKKALVLNFATAATSILGAILALITSSYIENFHLFIIPIAVGGFIYIAGSDLIPELHKEFTVKKSIIELITFIAGICIMLALLSFS